MVRIVGKSVIHRGKKYNYVEHSLESPTGERIDRQYIDHPGAAVIVPRLSDGRLVMIRNYRHTLDRTLLEFPAGTLEWGEAPAVGAARELVEETGYRAGALTELGQFFPAPGFSNEHMTVFLAEDLTAVGARPELDESIVVERVDLETLDQWITAGKVVDGKTLVSFSFFKRSTAKSAET